MELCSLQKPLLSKISSWPTFLLELDIGGSQQDPAYFLSSSRQRRQMCWRHFHPSRPCCVPCSPDTQESPPGLQLISTNGRHKQGSGCRGEGRGGGQILVHQFFKLCTAPRGNPPYMLLSLGSRNCFCSFFMPRNNNYCPTSIPIS